MTLQGLKPSECCHMEDGELAKSSFFTFIVAEKTIYSSSCFIYGISGGGIGWKRHMGEGLAKNVRTPSYRGLKLLKKTSYDIWTISYIENIAIPRSCLFWSALQEHPWGLLEKVELEWDFVNTIFVLYVNYVIQTRVSEIRF